MSKRLNAKLRVWSTPILVAMTGALLAGCVADEPGDFVDPARSAYYDRYPIKVVSAPVKVGVAARGGLLQPEQMNAVASFARTAKSDAHSRIAIRWPSASGAKGRQAASDAAAIMVTQGVPQEMIGVGSYPAGAGAPLQLSYERRVAVTKECGNWDENLAYSPRNDTYPDFGCAYQNNVAAMVANAEDFEHPRGEMAVVAANRTNAMKVYFGSVTQVQSNDSSASVNKNTSNDATSSSTNGN